LFFVPPAGCMAETGQGTKVFFLSKIKQNL